MKKLLLSCSMLFSFAFMALSCTQAAPRNIVEEKEIAAPVKSANATKIQVAILLDVSGSMDGLIEQAKSRLWNIVNTLTTLKYRGESPQIEIALYAYGTGNRYEGDYMYQITPLTTDLDLISEKLFALRTSGSEEYCGTAISRATKELEWGSNESDMKLIYIAGNEIFEQGRISYKTSIPQALRKDIYVNTIHCGDPETGIRDLWKDASVRGKGKFFNIDSNARVRYIETPYDDRISSCNQRLNDTYISYGQLGYEKQANQVTQDRNAASISKANSAERIVSKSKSVYKNSSWDLVDMVKDDGAALDKIKEEELPAGLQGKSKDEIKQLVTQKEKERNDIQKEIADLAKKRQEYIDNQSQNDPDGEDLGKAISESLLAFAKVKGYTVEN
ncbi:VWA domain-containing protein [Dysgonomonas sp. HDW5A]|uniref:vWA domain-containing protein n=1 Tax=Dysgonomonas sp. HDW5A TaxID=2714926 RepID=UPI001409CCC9|nr:vWA domain-containing protein [Dysgonomonas sp. HDW5A]QIK59554.1 VWA domain-containing protein [Dysgonomonas sp. HDW5A]